MAETQEEREAFKSLPEVQAQMRQYAKKQWNDWLNQPVPALLGKTPRGCEERGRPRTSRGAVD
jgi:hypothetical protein